MRITVWQDALVSSPKKTPALGWGISLFAVTHQGPAQGGKAGGGKPPTANLSNLDRGFKYPVQNLLPEATIGHPIYL